MLPDTSRPDLRMSRRTALATASLLALAGCRWGPDEEIDGSTEDERAADDATVTAAATAIATVRGLVAATSERHIGLAGALAPLLAVHEAHLALLATDASARTPGRVGARSAAALARVRRAETDLQARLAALAGTATSGSFARALASMSAAVAQQLVVLPELATEGPA